MTERLDDDYALGIEDDETSVWDDADEAYDAAVDLAAEQS